MPVSYILRQAGNKMGLDPSNNDQREVLLRFLNEAAYEVYTQADVAGTLMEQVFQVNGDQTISLPSYVGQLRAIRELNSYIPWHVNQMRPRYNIANWKDMWRNWRIKGQQALKQAITNEAPVIIHVPAVESPNIVVTIKGTTATADSITETLTISAEHVTTQFSYIDIQLLVKDRINNYNVSVLDADGREVSTIPNNMLEASYLIIDVSTLPWLSYPSGNSDHYVEILYKKALPWFYNDGDEFPAKGYDNIIVNKIMQLWAEEKGELDKAMAYDAKATRSMARRHEEENRATEDRVALVTNEHDELLTRLRVNRPGRHHASIYPYGVS